MRTHIKKWFRSAALATASHLREFRNNTSGSVTLEALMMFPVLLAVLLISLIWFDVTRYISTTQKATYAFADTISRESLPVDTGYLQWLADVSGVNTGLGGETSVQVAAYTCLSDCGDAALRTMQLCWSWSSTSSVRSMRDASSGSMGDAIDKLPLIPAGTMVVLTEQQSAYDPPFNLLPQIIQSGTIDYHIAKPFRFVAWQPLSAGGSIENACTSLT